MVFVLLVNQIPELWEPESIMTASTVGTERNLGLDNSSATCLVERGVKTLLKTNKNALSSPNNSSIPVCMRQYILKKGYKCSPLLRIRTQNSYFIVLSSCFIKLIHCATEFFRNNSLRYEHKILIYQLFSLTFISDKAFSEVALNGSVFEAPSSNLTDSHGECY